MGFLVICLGITILQLSRVDPTEIKVLDRKSTLLMQAAKARTEGAAEGDEKDVPGMEEPGMDSLRGSFGAIGSLIRARSARKASMSSRGSQHGFAGEGELRARYPHQRNSESLDASPSVDTGYFGGLKRHQLYDAPMPARDSSFTESIMSGSTIPRHPTIKFDSKDLVHSYGPGGNATHEKRNAAHPPPPPLPQPVDYDDDPFGTPLEGGSRLSTIIGSPVETQGGNFASATSLVPSSSETIQPVESGRGHSRSSSSQRYPRGDVDDDRDESMSLWNPSYMDDDIESGTAGHDFDGSQLPSGGIRLVTKSTRT